MKAKRIIFHSNWNYGDVFSNKEWVKHVWEEASAIGIEVLYVTNRNEKSMNLPVPWRWIGEDEFIHLQSNPFVLCDPVSETIFISTWVGHGDMVNGHNYASQTPLWDRIFAFINEHSDLQLKQKPIENYVASIEFEEDFLPLKLSDNPRKIFISNNPATSNQSFVGDHTTTVNSLAVEFPDCEFIITKEIETDRPNVISTNSITNQYGGDHENWGRDLPECGLISERCPIIVTNSSGPGTFAWTKRNLFDPNTTFIVLTSSENAAFWSGIPSASCKKIWLQSESDVDILNTIRQEIKEKFYD